MTHIIDRRKALSIVAAAPAAVALSTSAFASAGEDAELLRLWEQWLDQGARTLAAQDAADEAEKAAGSEIDVLPNYLYGVGWSKWQGRLWPTVFEHHLEPGKPHGRTLELRQIRLKKGSKPRKPMPGPLQNHEASYNPAEQLRRRYQAAHKKAGQKSRAAIMDKHNWNALDMTARREWEKLAVVTESIRSAPTTSAADHAIKAATQAFRACPNMTDWVGVIIAGGSTHVLRETLEVQA